MFVKGPRLSLIQLKHSEQLDISAKHQRKDQRSLTSIGVGVTVTGLLGSGSGSSRSRSGRAFTVVVVIVEDTASRLGRWGGDVGTGGYGSGGGGRGSSG